MRQTTILNHFLSNDPPTIRRKRKQPSSSGSERAASDSGSDVRAIEFEDADEAADVDSDESNGPSQPRRSTRLDSSPAKKKQRVSSPPAPASSSPVSERDDDSPRVSGSRHAKAITVVDSDSEQEPVVKKKKKVVRGQRPATPEQDDDLRDGLDPDNVLDTRLRRPGKKSKFTQALERMKQRKKGRSVPSEDEDDEDDENDDNASDPDRPFLGAKPTEDFDESDEGSVKDFIVDDEGTADDIVLPSAFRMQQNLSHHFKIICQFYVHIACAKNRAKFIKLSQNNEYFTEPLGVLRRKLSGIQDSLVTSSVWRPDFKNALKTYPDLMLEQMTFSIPTCDACHLGGRVSTIVGHLSGSRYHKQTFEKVEEDEDAEPLPKQFHLGKFCARRTRCFHQFAHWEHELYGAMELRVRNTEGWRKMDPDAIMESLDQRGVVEQEWKRVNELMESARKLEVASKRGEDDGEI